MAETTTHTPTPWRVDPDDGREIYDQDMYDSLASVWKEADAAFIVRAVNAHDELVAALKQCRTELEEASKLLAGTGFSGMASIYALAAVRVDVALTKAEGAPLDLSTAVEG